MDFNFLKCRTVSLYSIRCPQEFLCVCVCACDIIIACVISVRLLRIGIIVTKVVILELCVVTQYLLLRPFWKLWDGHCGYWSFVVDEPRRSAVERWRDGGLIGELRRSTVVDRWISILNTLMYRGNLCCDVESREDLIMVIYCHGYPGLSRIPRVVMDTHGRHGYLGVSWIPRVVTDIQGCHGYPVLLQIPNVRATSKITLHVSWFGNSPGNVRDESVCFILYIHQALLWLVDRLEITMVTNIWTNGIYAWILYELLSMVRWVSTRVVNFSIDVNLAIWTEVYKYDF